LATLAMLLKLVFDCNILAFISPWVCLLIHVLTIHG